MSCGGFYLCLLIVQCESCTRYHLGYADGTSTCLGVRMGLCVDELTLFFKFISITVLACIWPISFVDHCLCV